MVRRRRMQDGRGLTVMLIRALPSHRRPSGARPRPLGRPGGREAAGRVPAHALSRRGGRGYVRWGRCSKVYRKLTGTPSAGHVVRGCCGGGGAFCVRDFLRLAAQHARVHVLESVIVINILYSSTRTRTVVRSYGLCVQAACAYRYSCGAYYSCTYFDSTAVEPTSRGSQAVSCLSAATHALKGQRPGPAHASDASKVDPNSNCGACTVHILLV